MKKIKRLIDCNYEEMNSYNSIELKKAILKSEGRVICGQTNSIFPSHVDGVTNAEIVSAFGTDMIMMNSYHLHDDTYNPGLKGVSFTRLKELTKNLMGIYFECPSDTNVKNAPDYFRGRIASKENIEKAVEMGANFIVLGGNPGTGVSLKNVIDSTKEVKKIVGDSCLIMAGKWEDGVDEKVLGDPLADYDAKEIIKELADAGADVITLPAPGSRHGITVEMIRELVEFCHKLDLATLCFLNSSVEGADEDTIRMISLWMKQTGADIHAIGDAGYIGMPVPENIYIMSVAIRGRRFTFKRMAMKNRTKNDVTSFFI